jgi:hypothetical protein
VTVLVKARRLKAPGIGGYITMKFRTLFKSLALVFAILVSTVCRADTVTTGQVVLIQFWQNHTGVLVRLSTMSDPDQCGRADWYIVPDTHPHYKDIYALLLATRFSDHQLTVVTSGCYEGLPAIIHAWG